MIHEYKLSTGRASRTFKGFCLAWSQRLDVDGPGREVSRFDGLEQILRSKVGIRSSECIGFSCGMITDALIGNGLDSVPPLAS